MKKVIFIFVALLSMASAHANSLRDEKSLLKCVRKTINQRRMDGVAFKKTHELLMSYDRTNAAKLADQCKVNLKEFKKLPRLTYDELFDVLAEQHLGDNGANNILRDNIEASMTCKMGGIQADVAFGIGFGLGAAVGRCESRDGRIWGMFIPTAGIYIGGGATVETIHGEFYVFRGRPTFSSDLELNVGFIFAQKESDDLNGEGLGFGIMLGGSSGLALKVLPIGNNFERALNNLGAIN